MPHVTVHRSSTRRPALAGLVALTVFATLALIGTPASSLPTADDDTNFHISSDIVIKEDNTFSVKLTMSESGSIPALSKSMCNKDSSTVKDSPYDDFKVKFVEKDGTRTCTMEGTDSISTSSKNIKHEGDEYIVQTLNFDSISDEDVTEISQSVTFPGKVTEADGGTVEGTKVSFKDNDKHEVKGKDKAPKKAAASSKQASTEEEDSGSTPVWVWVVVGVITVAIVGGVAAAVVMNQRKKNQPPFNPYAAPVQGYDPNQAPLGQPMQQLYQPGYTDPAAQPYQQGQPTPQPYQPGYTEPYQPSQPTPQPYQPGYTNPAAQPYQPGYADPYQQGHPTPQPYQQFYNNQPGQPGQGF
ncbi:LppM family (lipo)protein [Actinomyces oris]